MESAVEKGDLNGGWLQRRGQSVVLWLQAPTGRYKLAMGVSPWRGKSQPAGAGKKEKVIQPGLGSNFFKIRCTI
jgi:hypothetical protein